MYPLCFTVEGLPTSLIILNLEGNPCQQSTGYKEAILSHCPLLSQLDDVPLTLDERRDAGHDVVSESDDSDDEIEQGAASYNYNRPFDAQVVGMQIISMFCTCCASVCVYMSISRCMFRENRIVW